MAFMFYRTILFLAIAVASANGRVRHKCGRNGGVPAYDVFKKCYDATFDLIRRGFAHDIATAHFQKALFEVSNSTADSKNSRNFGKACIPPEVYGRFFSVRWTTVRTETALNDMLLSISNSFYNPTEADVQIHGGNWRQRLERYLYWWAIRWQLRKPFHRIDSSIFKFPATIRHVQDPEYARVCLEWKRHFKHPTTPAVDGLRKVLRMVVNLLSVGCDPIRSWQILRHYTALVYMGIRCKKREKNHLQVPDQYFKDYSAAGLKLLKNAQKTGKLVAFVPFSDHVFEIMYEFIYERLATFGAWGVADMTFDTDMVVKNLMVFVNQSVHREMKDLRSVLDTYGIQPTVGEENGTDKEPDCKSKEQDTDSGKTCNTGAGYCYWERTEGNLKITPWLENCCQKAICKNAIAILPTITDYDECCRVCNEHKGCSPEYRKSAGLQIPHVTNNKPQVVDICLGN